MKNKYTSGFSLIELMVAMAMFLVVGGVAVSLVQRHVSLFNTSQDQAGINISMRNAVAQLEMDLGNAAGSYYPGYNMPFWPVGMTMTQATTTCTVTRVYISTCFDKLTVLTGDDQMPAGTPTAAVDTTSGANIFISYPDSPNAATLATRAARFVNGSEVMFLTGNKTAPPYTMAPLTLTANGSVNGSTVMLQVAKFMPTADNFKIYDPGDAADFTTTFATGDYVINLVPTFYSVNGNNQLVRQVGITGTTDVISDQVVGFTVSPFTSLPTVPKAGSLAPRYENNPANYNSNWASIRAVQITLVVRAAPASDAASYNFQNGYDQGPYKVQGTSVVVNPRNLTMDN